MYRSATHKVSDLNAHSKKKKQVQIDPVSEELQNFEQLSVEDEEEDKPQIRNVFSVSDLDSEWKIGSNDCNTYKSKRYINHYVFALDNTLDSKFKYVSIKNHLRDGLGPTTVVDQRQRVREHS